MMAMYEVSFPSSPHRCSKPQVFITLTMHMLHLTFDCHSVQIFIYIYIYIKILACIHLSTYDMLCDGTCVKFYIFIILTFSYLHVKQVVPQRSVWNRRRDRFEDPRRPWQLLGPTQQEECGRFLPVC